MRSKVKSPIRKAAHTIELGEERKANIELYQAKLLQKGTRLRTIPETVCSMIDRTLKAEGIIA
jgi:hypothetical protein